MIKYTKFFFSYFYLSPLFYFLQYSTVQPIQLYF